MDVVLGALLLAAAAPVILLLGLAVRATSPGAALFRQVRVGQGGRCFVLLKLRSMAPGAAGSDLTPLGDARVTPLGRWLRRTSLDELPQLWNVIKGDMTLVGPRPETPSLAGRYPRSCTWVFAYRPGVTGPAQLLFRDAQALPAVAGDLEEHYLSTVVPQKVMADALFLGRPTVRATLRELVATGCYLLGRAPAPTSTATSTARAHAG